MGRQKASDVVFPDDVETIRRDLEQGCKQLQGYHYQIVALQAGLRAAWQALSGHPDRRPRLARERVDDACASTRRDRDGRKVRVEFDRSLGLC